MRDFISYPGILCLLNHILLPLPNPQSLNQASSIVINNNTTMHGIRLKALINKKGSKLEEGC